jgi:tetratricopeptide (TPR) repeat protein
LCRYVIKTSFNKYSVSIHIKKPFDMKKLLNTLIIIASLQFGLANIAKAQLTSFPDGDNKRASVSEQIGLTDVSIHYSRPAVKKRDGHIWGELVPPGYVDQGFGSSKAAPWRAGANEGTSIEFSTDVKVEGQPLAAGKYGFFVAYGADECTLIFSKNSTSWGSFFYKPDEDVLRVKVKPVPADKSVERLKYEFAGQTPNSAIIELQWEKLVIPFKIEADAVKNQLASFRQELRGERGFNWESWNQAALYCAQNKTNLDEALMWADTATSKIFGGNLSFQAWSTKAMVLDSLGRGTEAAEIMKKALPLGSDYEIYGYGRTLASGKKAKEAFAVFKMNYDKHPDEFITNVGMGRCYSAMGDYKKALTYVQKAQAQAPNKRNKDAMDRLAKKLEDGKDIN